jgi:hypothetical protein
MDNGMNVVRKIGIDEFYGHIDSLFHSRDKPLRKTKADYASKTHSEYQAPLAYATILIERYKIKMDDPRNEGFLNNFGLDIRTCRSMLKALHLHVSVKPFVETLFYLNLLQYNRCELASSIEADLELHSGFAEFYGSFKQFQWDHQTWKVDPDGLLATLRNLRNHQNP